MSRRLSEVSIGRVTPPKSGRLELADSVVLGLSLRVTPDGRRTFALRYRRKSDRKQVRLTIGRYDPEALNLSEARAPARAALGLVDAGKDPAAKKIEQQAPDRGTLAEVVAKFVDKRVKPKARRWRDVEAMLQRDIVRAWGNRPIASITERDCLDLIDEIEERGSPVVANRNVRLLRQLFAWAVKQKYIESSPAADLEKPYDEKPRQRALSEDEIRLVWAAFETMGYPFGVLGKVLLLTGQRRGEVASMRWHDLDLDRGTLRLASTKTHVEHIVPLVPAVVEILRSVPRLEGEDKRVFPANRPGSVNTVSGFSKARRHADDKVFELLREQAAPDGGDLENVKPLPAWTWHDLRRTCRTHMARLGVPMHIGERILNHSNGAESAIARIYNVHAYQPEMRQALELWATDVERMVAGEARKVLALRA